MLRLTRTQIWIGILAACAAGVGLIILTRNSSHLFFSDTSKGETPPTLQGDLEDSKPALNPARAPGSGGQPSAEPIRSSDNPFSNTCDGKAIGFVGPTGEPPRMELGSVPQGARLECRSGRDSEVANLPFTACDGGDGTKAVHTPKLASEGTYRTEIRSVVNDTAGPIRQVTYYVHHSLDRVACCQPVQNDAAWFDAARPLLNPTDAFDNSTRLDNPFITIAAEAGGSQDLLSLRRTFRLSPDRKLLLIRRTMSSRRTFEASKTNSCAGLQISVPTYGLDPGEIPMCAPRRANEFAGGLIDAKCPEVYCTVTTCESPSPGCIQVTHTFNRGPGQKPWIVRERPECADTSLLSFTDYKCDAYVLDRSGQAACLVNENGRIRALTTVKGSQPPGLQILAAQRGGVTAGDRYVFSAKTRARAGIENVLYLPQ